MDKSIKQAGYTQTLSSLGFRTVRRPRAKKSHPTWNRSNGQGSETEEPLFGTFPKIETSQKKRKEPMDDSESLESLDDTIGTNLSGSPPRTPVAQIKRNGETSCVPPTPRKQAKCKSTIFAKDCRAWFPESMGICAACGKLTRLRSSAPICLRLTCAMQFALVE